MNLSASFVSIIGGVEVTLRPLTVRERIALHNLHIERCRAKAAKDCDGLELTKSERAKFVAEATADAEGLGSFFMSILKPSMALEIVAKSIGMEAAETLASRVSSVELGRVACRCMGVEFDENAAQSDESDAGKLAAG
jgi:hypothetical protein